MPMLDAARGIFSVSNAGTPENSDACPKLNPQRLSAATVTRCGSPRLYHRGLRHTKRQASGPWGHWCFFAYGRLRYR